jgi:hypothetical protein
MRVTGSAEKTAAVHNVALGGDAISLLHIGDEAADLHHIAGELVPDYERRLAAPLCPRIPVVDVDVSATDARATYSNENLVLTDSRLLDLLQLETGCRGFLHERFH